MAGSVIIADDDANIVRSLEFLMKRAGYDVRIARDGEAVLEAMQQAAPDVLLLDLMMPKRNGYDICQAIRSNPAFANVHVLMLTAKGQEVERAKGLALGADDYITKPFSTREVVERVRQVMAKSGAA
jgi:two-component system, OmpR family, alkaline phosphatase synthesis response regulator PhoP